MLLTRLCPTCASLITYKTQASLSAALKRNNACAECRYAVKRSPEFRQAESDRMKALRAARPEVWLNEESQHKKSESLKFAHQKPDSVWNTPQWRVHQSWVATQQALSGTHPFQLFSPEKVAEMAQKSRATNLMPGSPFQRHVAWRNTSEGHAWLSQITKRMRATNPAFKSAEYDRKIREHLTRARKLVKQSQSSKDERALAEALHAADESFKWNAERFNVGPYQPDIVNHEKRTIVEYYGDYSHSSPSMYVPDSWNALSHKTAQQVWDFDAKRKAFIEGHGWRVIIVWESEWKSSRELTIQRILRVVGREIAA